MQRTPTIKGLIIIFFVAIMPRPVQASGGKPPGDIKINYTSINRLIGDTTLPARDEKAPDKKEEKKQENTTPDQQVEVVKVIPKARRQSIPVPVKVNVQPVKVIKPKIIKPVVKPVIKILH
jgi:hypothetical protein